MTEKYYKFDSTEYNFAKPLMRLFNEQNLDFVHFKVQSSEYSEVFERSNDSETWFHKKFYDEIRKGYPEFMKLYQDFIRDVVAPLFPEENGTLIYQKTPTFRIHLPKNIAVGAFHRDRDYNHPAGEVNFIIPVNYAHDSACTITESEEGKMDFHQLKFVPDHLIQFNGNSCLHGNLPNLSGRSRVSLDFRVLPRKFYKSEEFSSSITKGVKFLIGEYYDEMNTQAGENDE